MTTRISTAGTTARSVETGGLVTVSGDYPYLSRACNSLIPIRLRIPDDILLSGSHILVHISFDIHATYGKGESVIMTKPQLDEGGLIEIQDKGVVDIYEFCTQSLLSMNTLNLGRSSIQGTRDRGDERQEEESCFHMFIGGLM